MEKRRVITQIGSLPYDNVKDAVKYSLKHDIPFLPELPLLGDSMLDYIKNPGMLSCLDEFSRAVKGNELVKVQCVGPITLIQEGYEEDDAIRRCYQHISSILDKLDVKETILFLDEPALGQSGMDFFRLWAPLFASFNIVSGVHVCGNMDWDKLFNSPIKIISHDSSQYDITKYPRYRNGKRIAWGINRKEDIKDFREGDLLTLPCGIGSKLFCVEDAERSLEMLVKVRDAEE